VLMRFLTTAPVATTSDWAFKPVSISPRATTTSILATKGSQVNPVLSVSAALELTPRHLSPASMEWTRAAVIRFSLTLMANSAPALYSLARKAHKATLAPLVLQALLVLLAQ